MVLRSLDKLAKVGREKVAEELTGKGSKREAAPESEGETPEPRSEPLTTEQVDRLLDFVERGRGGIEVLAGAEAELGDQPRAVEGIANLRAIFELLEAAKVPGRRLKIDLGLARGLDYYTGVVFETTVDGWERFGSVASGGRYDNLASLFTDRKLPGRRGVDRPRPAPGADGGGGLARGDRDDRPGPGGELPRGRPRDRVRAGRAAPRRGDRRRGLPRRRSSSASSWATARPTGTRWPSSSGRTSTTGGVFNLRDLATRQEAKAIPFDDLEAAVGEALGVAAGGRVMTPATRRRPGRGRTAHRPGPGDARLAPGRLRAAGRTGSPPARPLREGGVRPVADAGPRVHRAARAQERRGDRGQAVRAGGLGARAGSACVPS